MRGDENIVLLIKANSPYLINYCLPAVDVKSDIKDKLFYV